MPSLSGLLDCLMFRYNFVVEMFVFKRQKTFFSLLSKCYDMKLILGRISLRRSSTLPEGRLLKPKEGNISMYCNISS